METYASVEETIKQNIEYEVLMKNDRNDHELIQGICKLIVETMLYTGKRIVIASGMYEKCGSELERPYPSPKGKKKAYKLGEIVFLMGGSRRGT